MHDMHSTPSISFGAPTVEESGWANQVHRSRSCHTPSIESEQVSDLHVVASDPFFPLELALSTNGCAFSDSGLTAPIEERAAAVCRFPQGPRLLLWCLAGGLFTRSVAFFKLLLSYRQINPRILSPFTRLCGYSSRICATTYRMRRTFSILTVHKNASPSVLVAIVKRTCVNVEGSCIWFSHPLKIEAHHMNIKLKANGSSLAYSQ